MPGKANEAFQLSLYGGSTVWLMCISQGLRVCSAKWSLLLGLGATGELNVKGWFKTYFLKRISRFCLYHLKCFQCETDYSCWLLKTM